MIHQADLQVDGRTVCESQPFLGTFTNTKLLSELSQNDLKSIGTTTIGFSDCIDTHNTSIYNSDVVTPGNYTNGNGYTNNNVFGTSTMTAGGVNQNVGLCNEAINKRCSTNR